MNTTQLTCPHCGSTLTFGAQVTSGMSVECLICMQSFTAENFVESPAPSEPLSTTVPAASGDGATATAAMGVLEGQPKPRPPIAKPQKPAPSVRRAERKRESQNKGPLLALVAALVLLLATGVGGILWKISSSSQATPGDGDDLLAQHDDAPPSDVVTNNVVPKKGNATPQNKPAATPLEDDADTRKLKALERNQLTRKTPVGGANPPDWDPIFNVNNVKDRPPSAAQLKVNQAIDKGVAFLKKQQHATGSWSGAHPLGHAAIGGLTLLECKTPANDFHVQRAAQMVRFQCHQETGTYELSLAILFLDRLGDPRDRPLIQGMALRLLAGQNESGGWSYECPLLNPQEMYQLYTFLQSNKPGFLNPLQGEAKPGAPLMTPISGTPVAKDNPFQQFQEIAKTKGTETGRPTPKGKAPKGRKPIPAQWLQPNLRDLPVVRNQGQGKKTQVMAHGPGDNSNTQFAIMALWAARRHDVATDQAIVSAFQRFATSQTRDGGWSYHMSGSNSTHTMTCVGLLGLAMGHGVAPDVVKFDPAKPQEAVVLPALEDPKIKKGLSALARHIGQPKPEDSRERLEMQNLYFLWSVERVAMLYDLNRIDGKDWYGWGSQILVQNQRADGHWDNGGYHGANPALNTCFALLFLKRSNLVQDLTNNLRLYTGIRDPEK